MREILFKAKRKDNGEWIYGYLIGKDVIVGRIIDFEDDYFNTEFWYKIDPKTLCQYTGLKDVEGNKIFEGDFREGNYYCGDDHIFYKDYIVFEDCSFRWKNCEGYSIYGMPDFCYNKIEGNIHD